MIFHLNTQFFCVATGFTSYMCPYGDSEAIKQEFSDSLATVTRNIPNHNVTIVAGDKNSKLRLEHSMQHSVFSDETNSNGYKPLDLLAKCQLIALNTCFHKRKGKLGTFRFPNGGRSQIDYILLNKKWRNSARNCQVYSTFKSIGSDHWIVVAEIKLSLCSNKKACKVTWYDWSKLINDKDIQCSKNRFSPLISSEDRKQIDYKLGLSADLIYNALAKAHIDAAKK